MVLRSELLSYLNSLLDVGGFQDYCPNGLQVEGCREIHRVVTGVTACRDLIEAAVAAQADAIVVHHGYFWKAEDPRVVGVKRERLQLLLCHNINLLAYHLPLDAHPELGNNAQLASRMGFRVDGPLDPEGDPARGLRGQLDPSLSFQELSERIRSVLGRSPQVIDGGPDRIRTLGWCTGAAQGFIDTAINCGLDAFVSGEISEPTVHAAREAGIHYFSAGHHATERYGVMALGEHLAQAFDLEVEFIDIPNPV